MKLYMIRHGETDWNKERRLQGQTDTLLNEFGRRLALETAPALEDIPFDVVYTSPLARAKETAHLVLGDREIPVIEEDRIREMGFGAFEGMICKGEHFNIPDKHFHYFYDAPEKYLPSQGGESFQDVLSRLNSFLTELFSREELKDKTVLVSTHGAALCGMLQLMKKNPIEKFWGNGVHKNCAVTYADVENGTIQFIFENKTYYNAEFENW